MFSRVEELLCDIKIPKRPRKAIGDGAVESVTMGIVNRPFHKYKGTSKFTCSHPELWEAIQELGRALDPDHEFTTVTINHNVTCKPHKDKRNSGTTMIVAVGDYTGGELVIEGTEVDIRYKPHYFNGYLKTHWNNTHVGERWSLMYYTVRGTRTIAHRPCDVPILKEVYYGNAYHNRDIGFGIEAGDHWIDIGAHIGCWSRKVIENGGTVDAFEPDPDSYRLLCENIDISSATPCAVGASCGQVDLVPGSSPYFNKVCPGGSIPRLAFGDIVSPDCCVKMDIEGSELEILDSCDFTGIRKMVVAYHITADRSRTNLLRRVSRLRQYFSEVHHQAIPNETMNFFPNEIMIYCKN